MQQNMVLVTGGAGYIGSHVVLALREAGAGVVVLDNLSTGIKSAVPSDVELVVGDIGDRNLVMDLMRGRGITAVMHFAGSIVVPESVEKPLDYYDNNVIRSHNLIRCCIDSGVRRFVFSSTAAVYGNPDQSPIAETAPTLPINPYGTSKLMMEWMLRDTAQAHDFNYIALRYFNVAGADPQGRTGQSTPLATHLIKVASQTVLGMRPEIALFGDDYPTPDGTCIRDYIHVTDLADAHVRALEYLDRGDGSQVLNCGYGRGYSVREVLDAVERVAGSPLNVRQAPRRAGDPPNLVAGADAIRQVLGWQPRYDDLDGIVRMALDWERRLLAGKAA